MSQGKQAAHGDELSMGRRLELWSRLTLASSGLLHMPLLPGWVSNSIRFPLPACPPCRSALRKESAVQRRRSVAAGCASAAGPAHAFASRRMNRQGDPL